MDGRVDVIVGHALRHAAYSLIAQAIQLIREVDLFPVVVPGDQRGSTARQVEFMQLPKDTAQARLIDRPTKLLAQCKGCANSFGRSVTRTQTDERNQLVNDDVI